MASSSSTACSIFLKLSLPPPPSSTRPPSQLIPPGRSDQAPASFVRRQLCAAGAATMVVIGLGGSYDLNFSVANSPGKVGYSMPDELAAVALVKPERSQKESPRWSDSIQRCPPWRSNSFQVVVPENLPRPSAHRRWESVGNPGSVAPDATASMTTATKSFGRNRGCFSM